MSKVTYQVNIGGYDDKVRLEVDMHISAGLSKEDYETLRQAFQTIEDIAYRYKDRGIFKGDDEPAPTKEKLNG